MSFGTIHGIYTLLFMLAFIAFGIFVYLPRRKSHYDEAASLPFLDAEEKKQQQKNADGSRGPDQGE